MTREHFRLVKKKKKLYTIFQFRSCSLNYMHLVISRCCLVQCGKGMYKDSNKVLFSGVFAAVAYADPVRR